MTSTQSLITACASLAFLTAVVGSRLLFVRVREMRQNGISPQSISLSQQRAQKLQDSRASDNFNHLFEVPVLFYALCIAAIASQHIPGWLPIFAWLFVALRIVHSAIQCTYNKVMHRLPVFLAGFLLISVMWVAFAVSVNAA